MCVLSAKNVWKGGNIGSKFKACTHFVPGLVYVFNVLVYSIFKHLKRFLRLPVEEEELSQEFLLFISDGRYPIFTNKERDITGFLLDREVVRVVM